MSRLLRYLLIWLSCTAASVTAVIITIHFVVGSTRPTAPVAQTAPKELPDPPRPTVSKTVTATPGPSPTRRAPSPAPSRTSREPSASPPAPTPTPSPRTTSPRPPAAGGDPGCEEGGAGVYTVPSEGGKATVRFGGGGVCLISAVPNRGFTVSTEQTAPQTLQVTFAASRHRSEITATTQPQSRADVREVSW
ncbi:hypothetical protein ACIQFW_17295 [Streptomyces ardesiacus]|uniref:hypothetical protein n=1 Tax=Streptomyces ardesiacus TaxID=285564 RepID=UPI003818D581